jgi:Ferredoxin-like domain in Api92-like protein
MPNWVFNEVTLYGNPPLVERVKERLAKPNENEKDNPFSFWNIVHPKKSEMADYNTTIGTSPEHPEWKTMGDPTSWYSWNIEHWGCKWDSGNTEITEDLSVKGGKAFIAYRFDTAWSPPTGALIRLSKKYPTLRIRHRFEEEQGWGGEAIFWKGEINVLNEWDAPESEEEEVEQEEVNA